MTTQCITNKQVLTKGNYAIAQAAILAGCECYFGYPITPQSEIGEFMSGKMQELKRAYVCAESELAAINMVIGACSTGAKAMTSSSSCAVALMQEALSYATADQLPVVLISVMRGGRVWEIFIHPRATIFRRQKVVETEITNL